MSIMQDYSDIVDNIAQNVYDNMKNNGYDDEQEAINDEIDTSMIYYEDQATLLGAMLCKGVVKIGQDISWDEIWTEFYDDIYGELGNLKEKDEEH